MVNIIRKIQFSFFFLDYSQLIIIRNFVPPFLSNIAFDQILKLLLFFQGESKYPLDDFLRLNHISSHSNLILC